MNSILQEYFSMNLGTPMTMAYSHLGFYFFKLNVFVNIEGNEVYL